MKILEILASFYSGFLLRQEAKGLGIVACALLAAGFLLWRLTRFLKRDEAEEGERERRGEKIP